MLTVLGGLAEFERDLIRSRTSEGEIGLFWCIILVQIKPMIYGYARVSTDGQSVAAQVAALRKHGAGKVFREVASGAKTDRAQLRRLLNQLADGDVLMGCGARRDPQAVSLS